MRVGICAPAFFAPKADFKKGIEFLRAQGFDLQLAKQTGARHLYFAGTDEQRARAVWDFACDPTIDVVWSARGGYGISRLLSYWDRWLSEASIGRGPKPLSGKLFVGYSDCTALFEYVRSRWGWHTLHGEMPGLRYFFDQTATERKALLGWVRRQNLRAPWAEKKLKVLYAPSSSGSLEAPTVGGNLCVWASLFGTPQVFTADKKIAFLEETDESMYRVDRMVQQALASGAWKGARALLLGDFQNCGDRVPQANGKPLRPKVSQARGMREIFERAGRELGVPVITGLPVGHGPGHAPLAIGAQHRLTWSGSVARLELVHWDWLQRK